MPLQNPYKKAITAATLFLALALVIPIVYQFWGVALIADIYDKRSLPILNQVIHNSRPHPLEHYYAKAESLLSEAAISLVALSLILYLFPAFHMIRPKAKFLRRLDIGVFCTGLLFSMTMVFWLDSTYHKFDIFSFIKWQNSLDHSLSGIYIACDSCNYPIFGTLLSAGIFHIIESISPTLESETYIQLFRYVLALIDGANVLLVYLILRTLSIRRSLFWAGLIGLLPSSWVGGALWGQIDGFSQFGLLAFLLYNIVFLTHYDKANPNSHSKTCFFFYVIGSSIILSCLLLTKQLMMFSIPVFVCMVLATLYFYSKKSFFLLSSTFIGLLLIGVLLPDVFLDLKEGYFSHLQYIFFGGGSSHGNKISGNGFNIWMFLGRAMSSSSREPFFSFLSPRNTGAFLFLTYTAFVFGSTFRWFRKNGLDQQLMLSFQDVFLKLVFLLALTNLSFNVLLSGTHERHLYHFYPFILMAYLGLRQRGTVPSGKMLPVILIGSVLYGRFVWGILKPDSVTMPHEFVAAFHLGLLCFLTTVYVRHQGRGKSTPQLAPDSRIDSQQGDGKARPPKGIFQV